MYNHGYKGFISVKGVSDMMTKEVNDWIRKVETKNYCTWDIMEEFAKISKHLTKAEMIQVQKRLHNSIKH